MRIKILLVQPGEQPKLTETEDDLDSLQKIVGGLIEYVTLDTHCALICNEEGKLHDLAPNRRHGGDVIMGDFFVTRIDNAGDNISLTKEDIEKWTKHFKLTDEDIKLWKLRLRLN